MVSQLRDTVLNGCFFKLSRELGLNLRDFIDPLTCNNTLTKRYLLRDDDTESLLITLSEFRKHRKHHNVNTSNFS